MPKKPEIVLSFDFEWPDTTELGQKFGMSSEELGRIRSILPEKVRNELLPLLRKHSAKATFFCVGQLVQELPELISEIAREGHEIAAHGFTHRKVSSLSLAEFSKELDDIATAFARVGVQPQGFRAPTFSVTSSDSGFFAQLVEKGYVYDSSLYPKKTPLYGENGIGMLPYGVPVSGPSGKNLWEVPIPLPEVAGYRIPFGGGIYLRFLPWIVSKFLMRRLARVTTPVIYLHPWELWSETTGKLNRSWAANLLHAGFSGSMMRKLDKIMRDFHCVPCRNLMPQKDLK